MSLNDPAISPSKMKIVSNVRNKTAYVSESVTSSTLNHKFRHGTDRRTARYGATHR